MPSNFFDKTSSKAFEITAFSILGLLFLARPTTLVPTMVLLFTCAAVFLNADFRSRFYSIYLQGEYLWVSNSILIWFAVNLCLAILHYDDRFIFPENSLKMVMALTLLPICIGKNSFKWFFAGVFLAGMAAVYWSFKSLPWGVMTRAEATTNNPIHFGNLSAIVMILSVSIALASQEAIGKFRPLFYMSAIGGLLGAVASLTRSSFFVVFLCFLPLAIFTVSNAYSKWLFRWIMGMICMLAITAFLLPSARDTLRISLAVENFQEVKDGNFTSSVGARFIMWKTSWIIFSEHPVFGVGQGRFKYEMKKKMDEGVIPATDLYNQPHSDIMHSLSSGGALKLLAYLGILIAPLTFFIRRYRGATYSARGRLFSIMGIQVVGAYFLTGLTNSNFDLQIYSTTYAVLVCVLAKLSMQPESES